MSQNNFIKISPLPCTRDIRISDPVQIDSGCCGQEEGLCPSASGTEVQLAAFDNSPTVSTVAIFLLNNNKKSNHEVVKFVTFCKDFMNSLHESANFPTF